MARKRERTANTRPDLPAANPRPDLHDLICGLRQQRAGRRGVLILGGGRSVPMPATEAVAFF